MKNNTEKQNSNQELANYQILLKNLDDENFAREFRHNQLERAKDIIGDILSVMSGSAVITEKNNEWGHGNLLELFGMFRIKHKNFYIPDFLSDLDDHIFNWSMVRDECFRNWSRKHYAERNLDEYGKPLQTKRQGANDEPETEQPKAITLAEHNLQITANKISHILESDKVSDDAKIAFKNIIFHAASEANLGVDEPALIKFSLPLIINSLGEEYGTGVYHSLRALLDSGLVDEIEDELKQYEKRFDGRTEDELKVLDLSKSSIEDLSVTLSGLMHNPNLPKPIKDCLEDNLNVNHLDIYSPENILGNLKEMSEVEK